MLCLQELIISKQYCHMLNTCQRDYLGQEVSPVEKGEGMEWNGREGEGVEGRGGEGRGGEGKGGEGRDDCNTYSNDTTTFKYK